MAVQLPSRVRASCALDSQYPKVGRWGADRQQGEDGAPLSCLTGPWPGPCHIFSARLTPAPRQVEGLVRSLKEGMNMAWD